MAQVQADIEHLRALKRDIQKATDEINEALKRVERSLGRASWHDNVRQQFEAEFKVARGAAARVTSTSFPALTAMLQKKIVSLETYLN